MQTYEFYWDSDDGHQYDTIAAPNITEAVAELARRNPFDIGADGFYIDEDGEEQYIPWGEPA